MKVEPSSPQTNGEPQDDEPPEINPAPGEPLSLVTTCAEGRSVYQLQQNYQGEIVTTRGEQLILKDQEPHDGHKEMLSYGTLFLEENEKTGEIRYTAGTPPRATMAEARIAQYYWPAFYRCLGLHQTLENQSGDLITHPMPACWNDPDTTGTLSNFVNTPFAEDYVRKQRCVPQERQQQIAEPMVKVEPIRDDEIRDVEMKPPVACGDESSSEESDSSSSNDESDSSSSEDGSDSSSSEDSDSSASSKKKVGKTSTKPAPKPVCTHNTQAKQETVAATLPQKLPIQSSATVHPSLYELAGYPNQSGLCRKPWSVLPPTGVAQASTLWHEEAPVRRVKFSKPTAQEKWLQERKSWNARRGNNRRGNGRPVKQGRNFEPQAPARRSQHQVCQRPLLQGQRPPAQACQRPPAQVRQRPAQARQHPPAQARQRPPAQARQHPPAQARQRPPAQARQHPHAQAHQCSPAQVHQNQTAQGPRHQAGRGSAQQKPYSCLPKHTRFDE